MGTLTEAISCQIAAMAEHLVPRGEVILSEPDVKVSTIRLTPRDFQPVGRPVVIYVIDAEEIEVLGTAAGTFLTTIGVEYLELELHIAIAPTLSNFMLLTHR